MTYPTKTPSGGTNTSKFQWVYGVHKLKKIKETTYLRHLTNMSERRTTPSTIYQHTPNITEHDRHNVWNKIDEDCQHQRTVIKAINSVILQGTS